jgi:hypothetical protein
MARIPPTPVPPPFSSIRARRRRWLAAKHLIVLRPSCRARASKSVPLGSERSSRGSLRRLLEHPLRQASEARWTFTGDCGGVRTSASKSIRRRRARIRMDEDKPRERDSQLPGLASAKRILAHQDPSPRRRAPMSAQRRGRQFFWPPFARKPLIILDSEKRTEIF